MFKKNLTNNIMCGIFTLLNNNTSIEIINNEFMKGVGRGPEFSKLNTDYDKTFLGFHRLAINGLNEESNQPLIINDIVLICNGEIYNYKQLYKNMDIIPKTGSDCEVIIYMYLKYGIEQTLTMIDGVYAFVLYDNRETTKKMFVARDPFGVRPLYCYMNSNEYGFASELKCLQFFYNMNLNNSIEQFTPGTYSILNYSYDDKTNSSKNHTKCFWKLEKKNIPYFVPNFSYNFSSTLDSSTEFTIISNLLNNAVVKRCLTTERPVACLLSGGLDSSLIAALVNNYYCKNKFPNKLETYSIGLKESEDLKYAKIVAAYLDTYHTEIIVTEQLMFETIPEVIQAIESYDTTTVRASIGNYLLGKFIAKNSNAKVIFNGDGSDELFGGYLYMNNCPDSIEFDKETRRLLKDIHLFDVLRSDKSISSHGLEPRTPFLDRSFVNFILSIDPSIRNHNVYNIDEKHINVEKSLLRYSFTKNHFRNNEGLQILPDKILWRKKEAFSDGVSSKGRSLYQILQEKIAKKLTNETGVVHEANIETEKMYYRQIFDSFYPNSHHIVPYYWMPKYTNATDPSARTLNIYESDK